MIISLSSLALAASIVSSSGIANALSVNDIPADTPTSSLLSSAQAHLIRGETSQALVYYDAAIARDPHDYLAFFKRATTYLSIGRNYQATSDFNKVLEIQPGFEGAHRQLAKLRARSADWAGAREQYTLAGDKDDSEDLQSLIEAQGAASIAEAAAASGNWDECIHQAGEAIYVANRAVSLRELRVRCRFEKGEVEEGISDLQHVLQMKPGDIQPHINISAIAYYALGDAEKGTGQIKKCLVSDPDSKPCRVLSKQIKANEKAFARVEKALEKNQPMTGVKVLVPGSEGEPGLINEVKTQVQILKEEGTIPEKAPSALLQRLVDAACQAYYDASSKKATQYCTEALELDEDSFPGLLYKAKKFLDEEEYEASIATLQKAAEVRPEKKGSVVQPLLQKAQIELKRSKTKDYYKVLGVARDADERQVKAAYRKASKTYHPDKAAKLGVTKEEAEKKMAAVNEAYEVLSDPELRRRFDMGDDPNSHESQGNPFRQGGNPFGGGGGRGGHPFFGGGGGGGGQQFKFQFGSGGGGGGGNPFGGGFPFG